MVFYSESRDYSRISALMAAAMRAKQPGSEGPPSKADSAAKKYFGESGAARDRNALADYYRSRNIGCVVFPVDERLTVVEDRDCPVRLPARVVLVPEACAGPWPCPE